MAKKKVIASSAPLTHEEKIDLAIRNFNKPYVEIPEPTRFYSVGQEIIWGQHPVARVEKIIDDKIVVISAPTLKERYDENNKKVSYEDHEDRLYNCGEWYKFIPVSPAANQFSSSRRIHRAITTTIEGLLYKVLYFGLDDSPNYQRGYVWNEKDKERLLDSIFAGRDIGKMIIQNKNYPELDCIVDGKQRLNALVDFYLGKYSYKGYFFHELCFWDRHTFKDRNVQILELNENTPETEILELFIEMNYTGVPQTEEHLNHVRGLLEELKNAKN